MDKNGTWLGLSPFASGSVRIGPEAEICTAETHCIAGDVDKNERLETTNQSLLQ